MRVGVHIVSFTLPGRPAAISPTLAEIGRAAEEAGVTNLSVMDHYLQLSGRLGAPDETHARRLHHPRLPRRYDQNRPAGPVGFVRGLGEHIIPAVTSI